MSQANVELIQNLYAAFPRGDAAAVLGAMDPGIVWNEAENFPYAGRNPCVGPCAIAEGVFVRLGTEWEQFQAIPCRGSGRRRHHRRPRTVSRDVQSHRKGSRCAVRTCLAKGSALIAGMGVF